MCKITDLPDPHLYFFFLITTYLSCGKHYLSHQMCSNTIQKQVIMNTRQVTRATHVRNRICPRVKLIIKIIIILLIIFLGFIKSKGSFTIVNIYVLVQRVLRGEGGSEASVLFLNVDQFVEHIIKINAAGRLRIVAQLLEGNQISVKLTTK